MKIFRFLAAVLVVAVVLASCTTFQASGLSYTTETLKTKSLGDFKVEIWVNEFLGSPAGANLFNLSADATDQAFKDAVQKEIKARGGDAAINVKVVHQASFLQMILGFATGALWAPGTIIVTGTIIKYQ